MLYVWNPIRYQKQKKMMEERTIGVFWGQVQFLFLFFSQSPYFEIPQNEM